MLVLRCTKKLQTAIRLKKTNLVASLPDVADIPNWHTGCLDPSDAADQASVSGIFCYAMTISLR